MAEGAALAGQFDDARQQRTAADLGTWVFLSSEILFFGVLFAVYAFVRFRNPEAFAAAGRLTDITLGSANTAVLLTSSFTMALAVRAAALGLRRPLTAWLGVTFALGVAFLLIKAVEYHADFARHLVPVMDFAYAGAGAAKVQLFFWLYFVMTGFHALHLVIGIVLVAVMAARARRGEFSPEYFTPVETSGLYWHLVDVVWIFLYPLLYLVSRT